jgi:hypothetical protein
MVRRRVRAGAKVGGGGGNHTALQTNDVKLLTPGVPPRYPRENL